MLLSIGFQFSRLMSASYSIEKQFLEILFKDGLMRRYYGVPSTIYFSLLNAYSPDNYFEEKIKTEFDFVKME